MEKVMEELNTSNPTDETEITPDVEVTDVPDKPAVEAKPFYSAEELEALHPKDIDPDRVSPEQAPIVAKKTIKEYKLLQGDYTRKAQELSTLKTEVKTEETYFSDKTKNDVFLDFLKTPMKVLGDINSEIARLESVIPDDGAEEYRAARKTIAQWQAIKDEFREKKLEVSTRKQQEEVAEAKLVAELGKDAPALLEHAKELGYSEKDFRTKANLREALKKTYKLSHAAEIAQGKEVKPSPHKAAAPSGASGSSDTKEPIFKDDNEWFAHQQLKKKEQLQRRLGT
jgi:hypothetical protein